MRRNKFTVLAILIFVTALTASPVLGGPDADTLDGLDSTDFALANHGHTGVDADTLDSYDSTDFALVDHNHYYGGMAIVAKSGGDYTDPVSAINDIATWCGTPSASNPCLVKIMPGLYDIGANIITMSTYTSLKGADTDTTIIRQSTPGTAVIDNSGRSNISISNLTIEGDIGVKNQSSSSINISDVKFNISSYSVMSHWSNYVSLSDVIATGINPIFQQGGSLSVNDAKLTATCSTHCSGVRASDMAELKLNNLDIDATNTGSGAYGSYGIWIHSSYGAVSPVHEISNVSIKSTVENSGSTATAYGIYATFSGSLNLRDIDIEVSSPNGYEYGLTLLNYDTMNVRNVSTSGSIAAYIGGLDSVTKIDNSILGSGNTTTSIKMPPSGSNVSIANTKLVGNFDIPVGTSLACFNNYNANYMAVTCP